MESIVIPPIFELLIANWKLQMSRKKPVAQVHLRAVCPGYTETARLRRGIHHWASNTETLGPHFKWPGDDSKFLNLIQPARWWIRFYDSDKKRIQIPYFMSVQKKDARAIMWFKKGIISLLSLWKGAFKLSLKL